MRVFLCLLILSGLSAGLSAQQSLTAANWQAFPDSFRTERFWPVAAGGTLVYGAVSYGLYHAWYKQYALGGFRTFDDSREWLQMDKMGHLLTTYTETRLLYAGARWTGMSPAKSRLTAGLVASLLQGTVEVMDGLSANWGFSWSDIAANTAGMALFVVQDAYWQEQKFRLKLSANSRPYPTLSVPSVTGSGSSDLAGRARELYGVSYIERALKDYNTMTIWLSGNLRGLGAGPRWPQWLNLSLGYGAENLYGGFANEWSDEAGSQYLLDPQSFPRYRQWYLSPDIDLSKIPVHKPWLRAVLGTLNFIKLPAPALSYSRVQGLRGHWIYF
jgi:hypothetical protein